MSNLSSESVQYTITFINQSANSASFCVYQTDPQLGVNDIHSLAWFAKYVHTGPGQQVEFSWNVDYNFVWGQTGELVPGVMFKANQTVPADLSTTNRITLNNTNGAYQFINQGVGPKAGALTIMQDASIPLNDASVGIGMSGKGTFVVQAQPNINLTFTPHPLYWCAFGNFFPGEVIDIQSVTNPAQIEFPANVYSMYAILTRENTWKISKAAAVNALIMKAKKKNAAVQIEELDFTTL